MVGSRTKPGSIAVPTPPEVPAELEMASAIVASEDLVEADAYESKLNSVALRDCELTEIDLSRTSISGVDLRGSRFEVLHGVAGIRGVTIGADQVIPYAPAVFAETAVRVQPDEVDELDTAR